MLIRTLGFVLVAVALGLLVAPRAVAAWLGRPAGWGALWESFRGTGTLGDTVYRGYRAYVAVAGWLWLATLEALLLASGTYFLVTGKWL